MALLFLGPFVPAGPPGDLSQWLFIYLLQCSVCVSTSGVNVCVHTCTNSVLSSQVVPSSAPSFPGGTAGQECVKEEQVS